MFGFEDPLNFKLITIVQGRIALDKNNNAATTAGVSEVKCHVCFTFARGPFHQTSRRALNGNVLVVEVCGLGENCTDADVRRFTGADYRKQRCKRGNDEPSISPFYIGTQPNFPMNNRCKLFGCSLRIDQG